MYVMIISNLTFISADGLTSDLLWGTENIMHVMIVSNLTFISADGLTRDLL